MQLKSYKATLEELAHTERMNNWLAWQYTTYIELFY